MIGYIIGTFCIKQVNLSALFATVFMTATQYGLVLIDGQKLRTVDTV